MADIPFGGTGILRFGATFTNPYESILSRSSTCPRNALKRRCWDGKLELGRSILVRGEQEAVYSLAAGFGDCSYLYPAILKPFSASGKGGINNRRNLNSAGLGGFDCLSCSCLSTTTRKRAMADFRQLALDFVLEDDEAKLTELAQRAAKGVL